MQGGSPALSYHGPLFKRVFFLYTYTVVCMWMAFITVPDTVFANTFADGNLHLVDASFTHTNTDTRTRRLHMIKIIAIFLLYIGVYHVLLFIVGVLLVLLYAAFAAKKDHVWSLVRYVIVHAFWRWDWVDAVDAVDGNAAVVAVTGGDVLPYVSMFAYTLFIMTAVYAIYFTCSASYFNNLRYVHMMSAEDQMSGGPEYVTPKKFMCTYGLLFNVVLLFMICFLNLHLVGFSNKKFFATVSVAVFVFLTLTTCMYAMQVRQREAAAVTCLVSMVLVTVLLTRLM